MNILLIDEQHGTVLLTRPSASNVSRIRSRVYWWTSIRVWAIVLSMTLMLAACSAPDFRQPDIEVPHAFKEAPAQIGAAGGIWIPAHPADNEPRGEWWLAFQDAKLSRLMDRALAGNPSLAAAFAHVREARAIAGIAAADRSPQLNGNVGVARDKYSPATAFLPDGSKIAPATLYQANLTASYEVDLFGRVRSNVAATRLDEAGVEADYRSVLLSLQADVAQTYFQLRETDAEIATLDETVHLREETVHLTQRRYDLGDVGLFDLSRANTELSIARAEATSLHRQRALDEHALATLLGEPASTFSFDADGLCAEELLPDVPPGLPTTLLERRPDIASAQRSMEAANQRIDVARSAMFPALVLNADGGGEGTNFADVFKYANAAWLVGALVSGPIFDGGRNRANVRRSEAVLDESVASYRQHVLSAFAEVEDNLAGLRILKNQADEIDQAVQSAERSADLAQKLYKAGRSSYLELLDAQRALTAVQRSQVQLRGSRAVTTVALIRALGGGWDEPSATPLSQGSPNVTLVASAVR